MAIQAGFMSDGHESAGKSRFEAAHSCRLQFRVLPSGNQGFAVTPLPKPAALAGGDDQTLHAHLLNLRY